jgi:protein-ribulosamine 3-kinase
MPNDWESSWCQFFAKYRLEAILDDDRRNNGADTEIDELGRQCVEQVVPRLLGALENDGNTIKPVLLHGDLFFPNEGCSKHRWNGNAGTDEDSGKPIIYDPSAFFGHNEYEIGIQKVIVLMCNWIDYRCLADLVLHISQRIIS